MAVRYVDLHMHSPVSDGFWTTENLPAAARALDLEVLALTDHDDIAGVPAMTAACAAHGIRVIPAVEVSTHFEGVGYHLLLYNIDLQNEALAGYFAAGRRHYNVMCQQAIAEFARRGKPLDPGRSLQLQGDAVKVYHLVAALIEHKYAENMSQAYGMCNEVGVFYNWSLPLAEAISMGQAAGGLSIIAHPGRAEPGFTAATELVLDGMRAVGLDGIECFHSFHTAANVAFYLTYAQRYGLLIGAGSDSHGPGQSPRPLTAWPAVQCRELLERCGVEVAASVSV